MCRKGIVGCHHGLLSLMIVESMRLLCLLALETAGHCVFCTGIRAKRWRCWSMNGRASKKEDPCALE